MESLPPIESPDDQTVFPRLDKLISEMIRIFNGEEEVVDDKQKKGGKAPKKEDKKAPAKKGAKEVEEVKREPSAVEMEGMKAINTEKQILRYRIFLIRDIAYKTLRQMKSSAKNLYTKMEDWALYTHKVEGRCFFFIIIF